MLRSLSRLRLINVLLAMPTMTHAISLSVDIVTRASPYIKHSGTLIHTPTSDPIMTVMTYDFSLLSCLIPSLMSECSPGFSFILSHLPVSIEYPSCVPGWSRIMFRRPCMLHCLPLFDSPQLAHHSLPLLSTYVVSAVPMVNSAVTSCPNVFVHHLGANRFFTSFWNTSPGVFDGISSTSNFNQRHRELAELTTYLAILMKIHAYVAIMILNLIVHMSPLMQGRVNRVSRYDMSTLCVLSLSQPTFIFRRRRRIVLALTTQRSAPSRAAARVPCPAPPARATPASVPPPASPARVRESGPALPCSDPSASASAGSELGAAASGWRAQHAQA